MAIRLIVTDLDGTLLDEDKRIGNKTRAALERAWARGILFVPASGRSYQIMPEEVRALPFLRYVIVANGGGIYDCVEDEMLFRAEIPQEDALRLCEYMRGVGTMYDAYLDGALFMEQKYYDQADYYCLGWHRDMVRKTRTPVPDLMEVIRRGGNVQKMQMTFADLALRERVIKDMKQRFPEFVIASSLSNNLEVNVAAANKGNALRILCRHLGIDVSETIAFGDGGNDLTMLEAAGIGVAMCNGQDEVKKMADRITAFSNEEDGVGDFLEKYVL